MADGKNILLISYYFPPLGGGGVGRSSALARYLPEHGYDVHVVTVKDIVYPGYDYTQLEGVGTSRIYRTGSIDPARILYLLGKRNQKRAGFPKITGKLPLYLPDLKRGWNYFAYRKARELIRKFNIDLVITTSPPPSSHLTGLKLKMRDGVKWVADFRDFWFPLPIEKIYRQGFARNYAMRLKDMIVDKADEIVSVNEDIGKYLGRGVTIQNGAEESLTDLWRNSTGTPDQYCIGLFGTFNELVPVEPLLKAVREISDSGNEGGREIRIKHVGPGNTYIMEAASKYGLGDRISFGGYRLKNDAIKFLADCDLFYLALEDMTPYHILPGRTFELLMSGKPIVGMVPAGSSVDKLLREYPNGHVFNSDSTESLIEAIDECRRDTERSGIKLDPDSIYKYSTRRMVDEYARLIDRLV